MTIKKIFLYNIKLIANNIKCNICDYYELQQHLHCNCGELRKHHQIRSLRFVLSETHGLTFGLSIHCWNHVLTRVVQASRPVLQATLSAFT